MKAAVITEPQRLTIQDLPTPKPQHGEVLIRAKYVGICGTDVELFTGTIPYLKTGQLQYPVIPGHEWTGEIVQLGPEVKNFHVGDRVTGECHLGCGECEYCAQGQPNHCPNRRRVGILGKEGALAEFITMPARSLHKLPPNVDSRSGTFTEPLTVALYALEKVAPLTGKRVFINGLGTIGLLTLHLAKISGASLLVGTDLVPHRLQLAESWEAHVFHGKNQEVIKESLELSPQGFDLVVEVSGVPQTIQTCLKLAKPGGNISLLGLYEGRETQIQPDMIVTKDLQVFGNMASAKVWERALNLLESRLVEPDAFITHEFSFESIPEAFRLATAREAGVMKILIRID
jgi:2-desacetyl-2-hydroxyethyl bacteriochlorophyllide A dehydrogenase